MENWLGIIGLGLCGVGSLMVALADAWLSRSILVYLDAVESNVSGIIKMLEGAAPSAEVTAIDVRRDRGQNRARALKTVGWLAMVGGFGLQIAFFVLKRPPM